VIRMSYDLTVQDAKQVYNWFYHAFEEENNPRCTPEDIKLKGNMASQTGRVKPQKKCMFCGVPLTKKENGTCKFCKKFN